MLHWYQCAKYWIS